MKKGFTLIELLAVIVILAIIALIATPIILGIINDAEVESEKRSMELYASAVKNAIVTYRLSNTKAPKSFNDLDIQYEGDVVCTTQQLYEDRTFYLGGCKVNGGEKEYSYGTKQDVCTIEKQDESKYSLGDVVTCKLSEGTDKFYVIEEQPLTSSTIQMLTEKNISTTTNRQSYNAGVLKFSESNYWDTYPQPTDGDFRYVYDSNSNLYPYVTAYETYLKNNGLNISSVKLLNYLRANEIEFNLGNPDWFHSTSYWLGNDEYTGCIFYVPSTSNEWGSYLSYTCIYCVDANCGFDASALYGIRPVVTISTSDIG